jgi:hypothetical protein
VRHDSDDGKYTVINNDGVLTALRHGLPWGRDLVGDNLVYWMLIEVDALKAKAALMEQQRDAAEARVAYLQNKYEHIQCLLQPPTSGG